MKSGIVVLALILGIADSGIPATKATFANEQLRYSINWPSGLSLGEGQLSATRSKPDAESPDRLALELNIEAAIPGFQVLDHYRSSTSADFCSVEFTKDITHGKKKSEEKTVFDNEKQVATRTTAGGGKSDLKTPSCGKDALAFLYFVRNELSQGRLPASQPVFFGSAYQIRLEYTGTQSIRLADTPVEADRLTAALKGPSADVNFEIFFLKDKARTPALVRVPFKMGTFYMELVREP